MMRISAKRGRTISDRLAITTLLLLTHITTSTGRLVVTQPPASPPAHTSPSPIGHHHVGPPPPPPPRRRPGRAPDGAAAPRVCSGGRCGFERRLAQAYVFTCVHACKRVPARCVDRLTPIPSTSHPTPNVQLRVRVYLDGEEGQGGAHHAQPAQGKSCTRVPCMTTQRQKP